MALFSRPEGLCADRSPHPGHLHESVSLGRFWCTGDPDDREPGRSERRALGPILCPVCGVNLEPKDVHEDEPPHWHPVTPLVLPGVWPPPDDPPRVVVINP